MFKNVIRYISVYFTNLLLFFHLFFFVPLSKFCIYHYEQMLKWENMKQVKKGEASLLLLQKFESFSHTSIFFFFFFIALRFVENMNNQMLVLAKEINSALENEKYIALEGYNRLSSIMKEPLATMYSLDSLKNATTIDFSSN